MKRPIYGLLTVIIFGITFSWMACDSDDPVSTSDEFEITRYILESEDGKELYTTDIFPAEPFYIAENTQILYIIDSSKRVIDIDFLTSGTNFYSYDNLPVAEADVIDEFTGNAVKLVFGDTAGIYPLSYTVTRTGYFVKLYDDSYNYRGWRFWGYGTGEMDPPGSFSNQTGTVFSTDPPETLAVAPRWRYFEKNQIVTLSVGDSLTFICDTAASVFTSVGGGAVVGHGTVLEGGDYMTGWRVSASEKFYRLIGIDMPWEFKIDTIYISIDPLVIEIDTSLIKSNSLFIPFKSAP